MWRRTNSLIVVGLLVFYTTASAFPPRYVQVVDLDGNPVPELRIDTGFGPGGLTNAEGGTFILDAIDNLYVNSAQQWLVVEPGDSWLTITVWPEATWPKPDAIHVTVARRGDRRLLENRTSLRKIKASLLLALDVRYDRGLTEEARQVALLETAGLLGFSPKEVVVAVREFVETEGGPYERCTMALLAGSYDEAEVWLSTSLTEHQKARGDTARIAGIASLLGETRIAQEKYPKAAEAFEIACQLKPDDPILLDSLGLARRLSSQLDKSEKALRKSISLGLESLGPEHEATLKAHANLALTLVEQGSLVEARNLLEEVIETRVRLLGAPDPRTLSSKYDLAKILLVMGELAAAYQLSAEVVDASSQVLGPDHPGTLRAMSVTAAVLFAQGDVDEAHDIQELVLKRQEEILGIEHLKTIADRDKLATFLVARGDLLAALGLWETNLEIHRKIYGEQHPETLMTKNNLAYVLLDLGQPDEALSYLSQIADSDVLAGDFQTQLSVKRNLVQGFMMQGRFDEAFTLQQKVRATTEDILGRDHPQTLTSMDELARIYLEKDRAEEAQDLLEEAIRRSEKTFGPEDVRTLRLRESLGVVLRQQGRLSKARRLQQRTVASLERILGLDDPRTKEAMDRLAAIEEDLSDRLTKLAVH